MRGREKVQAKKEWSFSLGSNTHQFSCYGGMILPRTRNTGINIGPQERRPRPASD